MVVLVDMYELLGGGGSIVEVGLHTGPLQLDGGLPARRALMFPKVMQGHMNAVQPGGCLLSVSSVVLIVFIGTNMFRKDCSSQPAGATSLPLCLALRMYL